LTGTGHAAGETLRVLHCIYDDPANPWVAGGGSVRVRQLYRHLVDRVEATVVTGSYPGARDEAIDGVFYRRLGATRPYGWSRWSYARSARRLLRLQAYDAAVFDFSVYTPLWLPSDRPVGITVHHLTGPTARQRWGYLLGGVVAAAERSMIRRARWLSATSHATFSELRMLAFPGAHIEQIGAGVPDELFGLERREEDYLLFFGRMDWFQKGLDTLLEAVSILSRERPSLTLRMAGRGQDADRVRRWAYERGHESTIRILGEVSDAERLALFAGAKLLVMPSRFEGFGMVAAEAMAAGLPVVASTAGSLPEVVAPPAGGVLVPPEDPRALASEVGRLLDDAGIRAELSRSARRSADRFRWRTVAEQHLEFLQRIAMGGKDAPQMGLS
jgi:glycosyltransferase involved in cell wall biosynthesis